MANGESDAVQRVTRDVTARGIRMRVIEAGQGHETALLLIHDFWCTHLEFDSVIDELAKHFHVLAPDLPGFGESEKPSPRRYGYDVEAFAEAMADLIAAYGLGRAHVVGHGLGGAVGITLSAHYVELVNHLVLVAPRCYPHPLGPTLKAPLMPVIGSVIFKQFYGQRVFRNYFKDEVFSIRSELPLWQIDCFYQHFNTPSARESAYAVLQAMLDTRPVVARVTRIRRPTLIVWGRDDRIAPAAFALKLAREIPNARLELFDTGHAPHEERPRQFVDVVHEFFEGRRS